MAPRKQPYDSQILVHMKTRAAHNLIDGDTNTLLALAKGLCWLDLHSSLQSRATMATRGGVNLGKCSNECISRQET